MKIEQNGNIVTFYAENKDDSYYIYNMVDCINVREALIKKIEGRVSAAQTRMHEATTELAKVKKSWVYKVWRFISFN